MITNKTIITSGSTYTDIDALTCILVYADFLQKKGQEVYVRYCKNLSPTVTSDIKILMEKLLKKLKTVEEIDSESKITLVDVSSTDYLKGHIHLDNVIEVIDHHFGYESFRKDKLGSKAQIERIGSASTLIFEKINSEQLLDKLEPESLELLYKCVVGHTLNMKSQVTTQRDLDSICHLKKYVHIDENRVEKYFLEIDEFAKYHIEKYIKHETNHFELFGKIFSVAQVEMWDSLIFIKNNYEILKSIMKGFGSQERFLTSPSVNIGKNYILTESEDIKKFFIQHFDCHFDGDIGETKLLWMRKEILKKMREV